MLIGQLLRECSFCGVEALFRSSARRALKVSVSFGDDALSDFAERLDPEATRQAAAQAVKRAKRNKAFDDSALLVWPSTALPGAVAGTRVVRAAGRFATTSNRSSAIVITA
jgi:apolipoprotein N-acyltransferase